jgi:single-stranded-DNA-specific exonuclease
MPVITQRNIDPESRARLVSQGIDPLLARLFAARGVTAAEETEGKLCRLLPFDSLKGIAQIGGELADGM